MHIYDYLFTTLIIIAILFASSTMISATFEPLRAIAGREQLKVAAQKLLTQILLEPGDPPNWGGNASIAEGGLKAFGLARQREATREAYVLDVDKVLRLSALNPLYISPSYVASLLNLGRDYGFVIEISPAMNVSVASDTPDEYEVSVSSGRGGLPISNAAITARIFYVSNGAIGSTALKTNVTGYDGKCIIGFGGIPSEMKVLILVVEYYGVRVVKASPVGSNVITVHLVGNILFVDEKYASFWGQAYEIIASEKAGGYAIENVTSSLNPLSEGKFSLTYLEPSIAALLSVFENDGSQFLALAWRDATLTYSTISGMSSSPFGFSVERAVMIGGSAYVIKLNLWRMSW